MRCMLLVGLLVGSGEAAAGKLLDFLRSYDMNDYALGLAISSRESPFIGGSSALVPYPYLTSFRHSSTTDSWFLIRDGGYGLRWVTESDWELGVIARIRALGLGNSEDQKLSGVADREWTIELGPAIGYRAWPVHLNWTLWDEVSGRHGGFVSDLSISYPMEHKRGFIVPRISAIYESEDHTRYYFGVSEAEATPERPLYQPGSTWNSRAEVRVGYAVSPKWLLSATLGIEWLGAEITDSPIVGRDRIWFGKVGLAYNANVFNPTRFDEFTWQEPRVELRVGSLFANTTSRLKRDAVAGVPGFNIEFEDILDAPDDESALEAELLWRIGQHHRLEFGFFELVRNGAATLEENLQVRGEVIPEGSFIESDIDYRSLRFGYTFYLMRDAQKELGIMGGLHWSDFELEIEENGVSEAESSRSSAPLPVIGVNGSVFLGKKTALRARIHLFRGDFDHHEGSLNSAALELERRFGSVFSAGIGYKYYSLNLSSRNDGDSGDLKVRHHGPVVYVTVGF